MNPLRFIRLICMTDITDLRSMAWGPALSSIIFRPGKPEKEPVKKYEQGKTQKQLNKSQIFFFQLRQRYTRSFWALSVPQLYLLWLCNKFHWLSQSYQLQSIYVFVGCSNQKAMNRQDFDGDSILFSGSNNADFGQNFGATILVTVDTSIGHVINYIQIPRQRHRRIAAG